jgi:hypothetical protein
MAQTAFAVRVPEAEGHVGELRIRYDPSARLGVPAHITVLVPFMPPEQLSTLVRARIADAFAEVPAFSFELRRTGRFAATAFLVPEPAEPFIALTRALLARFPQFPPYGGAYGESILPHLTVANGDPGEAEVVGLALERLMQLRGPIRSTCSCVTLLENSTGRWEEMNAFELRRQEN